MTTTTPIATTKFAAIYNAGFPSPEDDFYCETLQELRDELKERDAVELCSDELTSVYECSVLIADMWHRLSLDNIFSNADFYSDEEWKKVLKE